MCKLVNGAKFRVVQHIGIAAGGAVHSYLVLPLSLCCSQARPLSTSALTPLPDKLC